MISKTQLTKLARQMRQASLDQDGALSQARVLAVIAQIKRNHGSQVATVLKAYKKEIERYVTRHTAVVETAEKLSVSEQKEIEEYIKQQSEGYVAVIIKENSALIGGITLTLNDTIYDYSVAGKFATMKDELA